MAAKKLREKPYADMLDGIPIVLFRDTLGNAQALVDRCPHRSVKLSIGKLADDGTIECPFHGWRFDGSGACRYLPLNPGAKLETVRAQALAVKEYSGMIWLFAGDPLHAPPLNLPPMYDPSWSGAIIIKDWNVHWSRGVQTQLDTAHIPFVHPKTIGAGLGRALGRKSSARLATRTERGESGSFKVHWWIDAGDGAEPSDAGWVAFHPPHAMSIIVPQRRPQHQSLLYIWTVPLTENSSRTIVVARRNFGRYSLLPRFFDSLTPIILNEDKRNLETSWPSEVPIGSEEVSMPADAPSIEFQKWYRGWLMKRSAVTS